MMRKYFENQASGVFQCESNVATLVEQQIGLEFGYGLFATYNNV